ncbi:MAG: hypothetical protein A2Z31_10520 [candidate division NC10 bacterium RBG_16_65_8]|nr:MAG: hypothetical protein A2Z31_10520 [candidate division NC10 bacterium RBG_16_65_8]
MLYVFLGCLIGLGLAVGLGLLVATPEELFEFFDPHRSATLFPITASRLREIPTQVHELVRDLVDEFTAPYRERLHREIPLQSPLP